MNWFREIFERDSELSSKRIIGSILFAWVIGAATYFILFKNQQTPSSLALIQFLGTVAGGMVTAGVAEKVLGKGGKDDGRNNKVSS